LKWLNRSAVLLLLLAVPALSTLAKNSWYLPQTDTGHYLTGAIKMKIVHSRLLAHRKPLLPVTKVVPPPQPEWPEVRRAQPELSVQSIGITVSLRYRSPPVPLL
jgi:hypothetical protein